MKEQRLTTCNRDCPDACGILATVEEGVVTALHGQAEHPVTKGFLCFRTSRFLELQNSPDRLKTPLLRRNGRLVPVSMEEALDVAAARLLQIRQESGPAAIFHYRSGGSLGLLKGVADRFFQQFGPCATKIGDVCSGAGEAAQMLDLGVSDSNDLFSLLESRHIFLWGKNPFVSSPHTIPVLKGAREAGAGITLIDPVHHQAASLADRVVAPRPGGDLALALGMGRHLFEVGAIAADAQEFCENLPAYRDLVMSRGVEEWAQAADLPGSLLRELAEEFVGGPTAILVGWGMQRRAIGGAIVRSLDALSAISGNLFRIGGGCSFYFRRRGAFDTSTLVSKDRKPPRTIREPLFARDVLAAQNPPIRAIWVTAGNPVAMLPDAPGVAKAFEETEFTVVVDPFLTDTARRASLVIPAPTLLEDSDLLGAYGHHWLAESRPVVPPPDGVLHELHLFQALAERTGLEDEMAGSIDDHKRRLMRRLEKKGVTLERLRESPVRNPLCGDVLFEDRRVNTPTGKVCLIDTLPEQVETLMRPQPEYPLWLFSNSTSKSQASQWAGRGLEDRTWVTVHPSTVPGRLAGDEVRVESLHGSIAAELRFDERLRSDVALVPKGGHFDRDQSPNALIAAKATDIGLGAAYLDCRVRVQ